MKTRILFCFLLNLMIVHSSIAQISNTVENTKTDKKRGIYFEVFSPLLGKTTIGYQQYLAKDILLDCKLGIIGLGNQLNETFQESGAFGRIGVKLFFDQDFKNDFSKRSNIFQGTYLKPELIFGNFNSKNIKSTSTPEINVSYGAFILNIGRQHVLGNLITFSYEFGLGYSFDNVPGKTDPSSNLLNPEYRPKGYLYSHVGGDSRFPIAVSIGFSLGVLIR